MPKLTVAAWIVRLRTQEIKINVHLTKRGLLAINLGGLSLIAMDYDEHFGNIGEALKKISEQMLAYENALAQLSYGLTTLKGFVADQISPGHVTDGLERIQRLQAELEQRDPSAKGRQEAADLLEAVRLMDKYGGPKHS